MSTKSLQIAPGFNLSAIDYANQANAILGIREAGKTYTAMKAAEELLEAGIPILVFDPVGVWKNLKIGKGSHKGFPVVVAGGEGSDIRLTKENAKDIVKAAMKENISLVIDLYSPELINKATWIAIVQTTVDLLMYENKGHSMRHIFIEEAAEFIPQRLQPQHSRVYASIERLARMGRNARLGMTIINQRAEEVNKAILEICELSLIHKQVGKNSLQSIQKWLEIRQLDNVKDIIRSLPTLQKGDCWAVGMSDQPQRIHISEKKTYHPDPKAKEGHDKLVSKLARDVTGFVTKMNDQLAAQVAPKLSAPPKITSGPANDHVAKSLRSEIAALKEQIKAKDADILYWKKLAVARGVTLGKINSLSGDTGSTEAPPASQSIPLRPAKSIVLPDIHNSTNGSAHPRGIANGSLGKCSREIIRFLAQYPERQFSKAQVAIATGYSAGSGGFNNALSELNQKGFILRSGKLQVNPDAMEEIIQAVGGIQHQDYNIETYKNNLGKCERQIYELLLSQPKHEFAKHEIAEKTGYSGESGGFNNALSRLNTLELIERSSGQIRLNPELLELMNA